jgi:hypothetical protein
MILFLCTSLLFLEFISKMFIKERYPEDREDMPKDEFLKSNKNHYVNQYIKMYYEYIYLKSVYSTSGIFNVQCYFNYRLCLFMFFETWNIGYILPYYNYFTLIIGSAFNALVNFVMYKLLMRKLRSLSALYLFIRFAYPDKSIMDPPASPSTIIVFTFPILCKKIQYYKSRMKLPSWYPIKAMKGSTPETFR